MKYEIIGNSEKTKKIHQLIRSIAPTDASVLITGESGCGKELVAREIHAKSNRSSKPFIAINCGAIPGELLESQLFGHKKGAFTGAIADYVGKFQQADGGTLFLDEIGDMPYEMQVKLLRVLQERNLTPIGSNRLIDVDVRVLAATHTDIEKAITEKKFRQDLYFRLNVLPAVISPLRERSSEIPELVRYFSDHYRQRDSSSIRLSQSFLELMEKYDWPGNVRELSNTIHRFSILYAGRTLEPNSVDPTMLPAGMKEILDANDQPSKPSVISEAVGSSVNAPEKGGIQNTNSGFPLSNVDEEFESIIRLAQGFESVSEEKPSLKAMLGSFEQDLIAKALSETGGNVSRCAKLLKMQRTTLIERIKKYDLQPV